MEQKEEREREKKRKAKKWIGRCCSRPPSNEGGKA